jgi:transposase-like protein
MQKRTYAPEFKTKIVLEVLEGNMLAGEIAAREGINPKVISSWKQEFLKNANRAFTVGNEDRQLKYELKASKERENELAAKVGSLIMEVDWLKKKSKEVLGYEASQRPNRKR